MPYKKLRRWYKVDPASGLPASQLFTDTPDISFQKWVDWILYPIGISVNEQQCMHWYLLQHCQEYLITAKLINSNANALEAGGIVIFFFFTCTQ